MKKRLVPLIAIVPLVVAIAVIVNTASTGDFVLFIDEPVDAQQSITQTYKSSLALCEEKYSSGSSDELEYEECINTVEEWYAEQSIP